MRQRYEVLDGLRGTAALAVVIFHICEVLWPDPPKNPLHHAYLAVDFFFMLSGFVVAHAYDDRWPRMSLGQFFARRLTRLHPLIVLGALLGLVGYVLDPFVGDKQSPGAWPLLATFVAMLFVLPSPALPNRWGETHSLNGPTWTLFQEYLANIAYALVLRRLGPKALAALAAVAAAALIVTAATHGTLGAGWGWDSFWIAPVRLAFPFIAGLLLQRAGARLRLPGGWAVLSVILLAAFALPSLAGDGPVKPNGVLEALLVIGLFPLVIAAGAAAEARGRLGSLCRFCGELSYPLYALHYPFIYVFGHWCWRGRPPGGEVWAVAIPLACFLVAFAWVALRFYDEPLRAWLSARGRGPARIAAE